MTKGALLALVLVTSCPLLAKPAQDLTSQLRVSDQKLLDAIAPGDRAVWEGLIGVDFFYADENDQILSRDQFLKQLVPLPKGVAGTISISKYEVHRTGDTAIVVHRDEETEHYFGSELYAQYLMTEVWRYEKGTWKLLSVHCAAVPADPTAVHISEGQIDELVGTFHAGMLTYVVRRDGKHIFGGQPGHRDTELKAETRDVLFVPGQPRSRKVFVRDSQGKVIGFADRRENRDLTWTKAR